MALPNLSGSNIQDTYQRVLHTDGDKVYDGAGNIIFGNIEFTSLQAINSAQLTSTEWGYLAGVQSVDWSILSGLNQNLDLSANVAFETIRSNTSSNETRPFIIANGGWYGSWLGEKNDTIVWGVSGDGTASFTINVNSEFSGKAAGLHSQPNITINELTASGDINSNGTIYGRDFNVSNRRFVEYDTGAERASLFYNDDTLRLDIGKSGVTQLIDIHGDISSSGDITTTRTLTARGLYSNNGDLRLYGTVTNQRISGSGDMIFTSGQYQFTRDNIASEGETALMLIGGNTKIDSDITASGNISCSGDLYFNEINGGTF